MMKNGMDGWMILFYVSPVLASSSFLPSDCYGAVVGLFKNEEKEKNYFRS